MRLNLFYQEPEADRWVPCDRYVRRVVRRLVRCKRRLGGQQMVFVNLAKGLDRLGVGYRVNDFSHARRHPGELACIVGKPQVLFERSWRNPVLFGAAVFSHPVECPNLFERYPVRRMLVPGEWMRKMCEPYYGERVSAWPVGIDTDEWAPSSTPKTVDVLLYDKVRWDHDTFEAALIAPIQNALRDRGLSSEVLRYGFYEPHDLKSSLSRCRSALFLCEHETQGLAYQQMLASGVPVLAWNRGGFWQDPAFFPKRVQFSPVSSVPYWDERCGRTFESIETFESNLELFWEGVNQNAYFPRDYVLENLTLEKCARGYLEIVESLRV